MSNFIVPLSNLPTISSVGSTRSAEASGSVMAQAPFADILQNAIQDISQTRAASSASTYNMAIGGSDDMHTGAINSLKYSSAVNFASSVTSSVIRAYNELMRMQV